MTNFYAAALIFGPDSLYEAPNRTAWPITSCCTNEKIKSDMIRRSLAHRKKNEFLYNPACSYVLLHRLQSSLHCLAPLFHLPSFFVFVSVLSLSISFSHLFPKKQFLLIVQVSFLFVRLFVPPPCHLAVWSVSLSFHCSLKSI